VAESEQSQDGDADEVPDDVMHLLNLANFNGVCRLIAALARNGCLSPDQLENIEDCMTAPLDDEQWRDNESLADARDTLVTVLARAVADSRNWWEEARDSGAESD
jgi:hypothetical protein